MDGPLKNIFFLWQSEIPDDHEDKSNIEPYRKNISQLFLSETVEAFVGKGVSMIRVDVGPISETVYIDIILNTIIER